MDDNDFRRNEIAATLFAVLSGLALLLLMGWLSLGKGCSRRDSIGLDHQVVTTTPTISSEKPAAGEVIEETEAESLVETGPADQDEVEFVSLQKKVEQRSADLEVRRVQTDFLKLKEEMESLRLDLGTAEEKNAGFEAKLKELENEVATARKSEGEKQTQLDIARQENKRLDQLVKDARKQADELKALNVEKDSLSKKLTAAIESRSAAEAVVNALKNKGTQGDEKMSLLNSQIDKLEAKLKESDGLKTKITDLEAKVKAGDSMKTQVSSLEAKLKESQAAVTSLEAKLKESTEMKTRIASLEKKLDEVGKEKVELSRSVDKLKTELSEANKKMTATSEPEADVKSLNEEIAKLKATAATISKDASLRISKLTSDKKELTSELEKLKKAGATEMSSTSNEELKTLEARIEKLTKDNKELGEELARLRTGGGAQMNAANDQLRKLTADNARLTQRLAALAAGGGKMNAETEAKIKSLNETNQKLTTEIASLKKSNADNMKASGELEKIRSELDNAQARIKSMESEKVSNIEPERLKAAVEIPDLKLPLLIQDPAKLNSRALPVFAELRGIDDNPEAREKVYSAIESRGNATPMNVVKFDSGSDVVGSKDEDELKKLLASDKDAMFLVVGYASVDGDPQSNAKLSSRRASNVAQKIVGDSGAGERVQAVYFGQTNRFSGEYRAPNRIVEVWKIK